MGERQPFGGFLQLFTAPPGDKTRIHTSRRDGEHADFRRKYLRERDRKRVNTCLCGQICEAAAQARTGRDGRNVHDRCPAAAFQQWTEGANHGEWPRRLIVTVRSKISSVSPARLLTGTAVVLPPQLMSASSRP